MITSKFIFFIGRVLKKLSLYNFVSCRLFRSHSSEDKECEFDECMSRLHALSPDKGSSAIRTEPTTILEDYDIQIIVPTYNEERHIAQCIESIIGNETTYKVLTTIVNDGSTDDTSKILQRYSALTNLEIIHQENRGFSGARNRGLEKLLGRFIMFVDSDDKLPKGSIQKLLNKGYATEADIIGGYLTINHLNNIVSTYTPDSDRQHGYPWGKIYKSHLFKDVQFPENYWFEDTVIGAIIDKLAAKTVNIPDPVYCYLDNPNGITHRANGNKKVLDSLYVTQQLLHDREAIGLKMTNSFYQDLLYQLRMNQWRVNTLQNMNVNKDVFIASRYLISRYPDFKATDKRLELLEWSLRNNNFSAYLFACV